LDGAARRTWRGDSRFRSASPRSSVGRLWDVRSLRAHNSRRVPRADESSDDAPELREIDEEDLDQDWDALALWTEQRGEHGEEIQDLDQHHRGRLLGGCGIPRADESSDDAPELREIDEEDLDQDWEEEEEDGPKMGTARSARAGALDGAARRTWRGDSRFRSASPRSSVR
jgi:hypothetical protein